MSNCGYRTTACPEDWALCDERPVCTFEWRRCETSGFLGFTFRGKSRRWELCWAYSPDDVVAVAAFAEAGWVLMASGHRFGDAQTVCEHAQGRL